MKQSKNVPRVGRVSQSARRVSALVLAGALLGGSVVTTQLATGAVSQEAQAASEGPGIQISSAGVHAGGWWSTAGGLTYCAEPGALDPSGGQTDAGVVTALPAYSNQTWTGSGFSGTVSAPALTDPAILRQMNYILAKWGQTNDPGQSAAVSMAIWKLREVPGNTAYLQHIFGQINAQGQGGILTTADDFIREAQAEAVSVTPPASPLFVKTGNYKGILKAPAGTTSLVVTNGIFTSTGTNTVTVTDGQAHDFALEGRPSEADKWNRHYKMTINGTWSVNGTSGSLVLHQAGSIQQNLVTAAPPEKRTGNFEVVIIDPDRLFSPVFTSKVPKVTLKKGDLISDTLTVGVAAGSEEWFHYFDAKGARVYAPIKFVGEVFGPMLHKPAVSQDIPADVAKVGDVTFTATEGPKTYDTPTTLRADETGFYAIVWHVADTDQIPGLIYDESGKSSLPPKYFFADPYGLEDETQIVPTELNISTKLKKNMVTLADLSLTDTVTPTLVEGGWLQQDKARIPAKIRLTVYGTHTTPEQQASVPADAQEIARGFVDVNVPKQSHEAEPITIPFEAFKEFSGGTIQACLFDEDQAESAKGHFEETCDEYGVPAETFEFIKPKITTKALERAAVDGTMYDVGTVFDGDLPEGSTMGFTAFLRPVAGMEKYDTNWAPVLDENGNTVLWTQDEIDALSPEALCVVQPVAATERVPVSKEGDYKSPLVGVNSYGDIDWVEDTLIPHPETGEPVEWSRGMCGDKEEHTKIPEPEVTTQVQLEAGKPGDENWDNIIVKDLVIAEDSTATYEADVDVFFSADAKGPAVCTADTLVLELDKTVAVTGDGVYESEHYTLLDEWLNGRLDHVETLTKVDGDGTRTVIHTGKCGAENESSFPTKTPPPVPTPESPKLVQTGSGPMIGLSVLALVLMIGGGSLMIVRRRALAAASTEATQEQDE